MVWIHVAWVSYGAVVSLPLLLWLGKGRVLLGAPEALRNWCLGEVDAKGIDVEAVQKRRKALCEAGKRLVHELKMHKIGLQIRHAIAQLGKDRFEA